MKIAKRFAALVVAGVLTIPGVVAAIDWPTEFDLLIPKDATDIERYDFSEDGKLQLSFYVKRSYPKFALGREQYAKLQENGWTECKTKRDEWSHFFDASDQALADKRCRYTFSKRFIRGSHSLFVMQERYSKHEGVKNCPATPDNNEVDVTVMYEKYGSLQELKSSLRLMEISCD